MANMDTTPADAVTLLLATTARADTDAVNSTNGDVDVMKQAWLRAIFITLYCLIFLIGVSGNVLVMFIVLRNKAMQTITNIFITNLAASDILICIFAVPFTPLAALMESWVFGEVLCHLVPTILVVNVFVSTLTSIAIAIDRYLVIVHPFKPRMRSWHCVVIICLIWFVSICTSLPTTIFQRHQYSNMTDGYDCIDTWDLTSLKSYAISVTLLQYVFPCIIITYCYAAVAMLLRKRSKMKIGSKSQQREQMEIRRKRRTNRMLVLMIVIFICCWMPLNTFHLVTPFIPQKDLMEFKYFLVVFFSTHVIAMSSCIYNPFLYAYMNDSFRKEFQSIIPCLFPTKKPRKDAEGTTYMAFESQMSDIRRASQQRASDESPKLLNGDCANGCSKKPNVTYESDCERVHLNPSRTEMTECA